MKKGVLGREASLAARRLGLPCDKVPQPPSPIRFGLVSSYRIHESFEEVFSENVMFSPSIISSS